MKNKMADLNNHLFETLEFLGDREIKKEDLAEEIGRAKAMCEVAEHIVAIGNLAVEVAKVSKLLPETSRRHLLPE
jgi:hypothetical protein